MNIYDDGNPYMKLIESDFGRLDSPENYDLFFQAAVNDAARRLRDNNAYNAVMRAFYGVNKFHTALLLPVCGVVDSQIPDAFKHDWGNIPFDDVFHAVGYKIQMTTGQFLTLDKY